MKEQSINRRSFLKRSAKTAAGAAAIAALSSPVRALGANDKFVVAIVGCGARGKCMPEEFSQLRHKVEIAYISDPDHDRMNKTVKTAADLQTRAPQAMEDFRRMLDDKSVDAVFNATPDHWHALVAILACQAGKDVYTEKPASYNIWEGQQMIAAARKYKRIVQMGNQTRSAPYVHKAIEFIRSGKLGPVHLVKVFNMKSRKSVPPQEDAPVPPGVNYDLWLGPAPARPFNPNHFHYNWHWYWNYSGGDIINDAVHQVDLGRWVIDRDYPKSVFACGGKHFYDDDQETPDTQIVTWEYDKLTMVFEQTLWTPYIHKSAQISRDKEDFPVWMTNSTRVEVYGSQAMMMLGRHGDGWQVFERDGKVVAEAPGRQPLLDHENNFFDCVISRGQPNSDILEGHRSTILCLLGNISYRLGGRKLIFDGKTESIVNEPEAQKYIKRISRPPYTIPEKV